MEASTDTFEATLGGRKVLLKENAKQTQKILDEMLKQHFQADVDRAKQRLKVEESLLREIQLLRDKQLVDELSQEKEALLKAKEEELRGLKQLDKEYEDEIAEFKEKAVKASHNYELERYKKLSAEKRKQYNEDVNFEVEKSESARKKELNSELNKLKELKKQRAAIKDKKGAGKAETEELDKKIEAQKKTVKSIQDADPRKEYSNLALMFSDEARRNRREDNFQRNNSRILTAKENIEQKSNDLEAMKESHDEEWKNSEKHAEFQKKIAEAERKGEKTTLANLKAAAKLEEQNWKKEKGYLKDEQELEQEIAEEKEELKDAEKDAVKDTVKDNLIVGLGKAVDKVADNISGHMNDLYGSQGRMMGRLQGSDVKWNKSVFDVTTTVGISGLVSQKNVVAKMVELVDSGVAYNLEMRAFLAETSQNIASTFDAANGTLLRMIRLQQADTTAARLGMEASLTKLFNEYFSDTSYLTASGPADTVLSTIMDASATMDKNKSLEFEFTVQKWLGSLYSLGMSDQTIQSIAQGINYLGTGNVQALSGNTALQTLFAMSASRAGGKSFAQMLTTGLTADDTNKLLKAMVEYLAEIAEGQSNFVSKAAYADLFGMSLTDLSTFTSLKDTEISSLYKSSTNYDSLMDETKAQLRQVITRVSMSQMLDTVIENAEVGAASLVGSNPVTYAMWKALSILKEYVGEVKIPGILGFGTGISSGLDLLNLAQTAMAGMGLIGSLVAGVASMDKGGAMNLEAWNFKEFTSRGSTLSILEGGAFDTTSSSGSIGVGSGDGSAVSDVSMESGKEKGQEASGITSEEMEEQQELPQKIYDALAGETTPNILSVLQEIDERLDPGRVFYTAIAGVLSSNAVSQVTNLSAQLANVTPPDTTNNNTTTTGTSNAVYSSETTNSLLTGEGHLTDNESAYSLEAIIASAIAEGLRQYSYGGNYVNIGSNSYWGGRP